MNTPSNNQDQSDIHASALIIKRFAVSLCIMTTLAICVVTLLFLLVFDFSPKHLSPNQLSGQEFNQTANFIRRVSKKLIGSTSTVRVTASAKELQSALIFTERSQMGISGQVNMHPSKAAFKLSVRLPLRIPIYLNGQFSLIESVSGIQISDTTVGNFDLSDSQANALLQFGLQITLGHDYAKRISEGIRDLTINQSNLEFTFTPIGNPQKDFANAAKRISQYTGQEIKFHQSHLQHYLDFLADYNTSITSSQWPLEKILEALLTEAHTQSEQGTLDLQEENLNALYSLTIQSSPDLFGRFVPELQTMQLLKSKQYTLTLQSRSDLAKHFVSSIGLYVLAEKGVSFSIGQAKEEIDSVRGSGFSFADLAADRAGIHFAELATDSTNKHKKHSITGLAETDFFPNISDLPEGLSEREFKDQFEDTSSEKYQNLIKLIDRKILSLPHYQ